MGWHLFFGVRENKDSVYDYDSRQSELRRILSISDKEQKNQALVIFQQKENELLSALNTDHSQAKTTVDRLLGTKPDLTKAMAPKLRRSCSS